MFLLTYLVFFKTSMNQQYEPRGYDLVMGNKILEGIRIIGEPPDHLNLSYLDLSAVGENAFTNLTNLKVLNLANNQLETMPSLSYLSNLESLILENNNIGSGQFYVGLSKLKVLNIAGNPLKFFEPGHFFGLPKSANLWIQGLDLLYISPAMFEHPETGEDNRNLTLNYEEDVNHGNYSIMRSRRRVTVDTKVFIHRGRLTSVKESEYSLPLPQGRRITALDSSELILIDLGIEMFGNGWYQVQDQSVNSVVLSNNIISELSEELLNHLPAGIHKIDLSGNKIKILRRGIVESRNNIKTLDLSYNSIIDIEYGALEKLNLIDGLFLDHNYLTGTRFLDSLPPLIQHVSMSHNNITELSYGNFTKFTQFTRLILANNHIKELKENQLHGFSSLTHLSLQTNELEMIELGAFKDPKNLLYLDLSNNKISNLDGGIFDGLDKIRYISLYGNEIQEQLRNLLAKMPNSLKTLRLGANKIRADGAISVLPGPQTTLNSTLNQFSMNMSGLYNFPNLRLLDLNDNSLIDIDGDLFEGLENLHTLLLAKNKIKTVEKGLTRNLGNLHILNISENPITILTNGTLFGLAKNSRTRVFVNRVPIQMIQAGVFDDV